MLHAAVLYLQTAIVQLLLEKGANIHTTANQVDTALHSVFIDAIIYPNLKDPQKPMHTITVLLIHRSNILQKDDSGKTPLDLAEAGGYSDTKMLFLWHLKKRNLKSPQEAQAV